MNNSKENSFFTKKLLWWNEQSNNRTMPWKAEKNPYKIWLSEIILQQTRVEQGLAYYNRFVTQYPTIEKLALANDDDVFKLWEGLGYYSRCKNLLATARIVAFEHNGIFPNSYESILALKGVGPYTAAAIASFAYNQPYAVVDGNVLRVLARFFGIATPIDSTIGKKIFTTLAQQLIQKQPPATYNQAIMDFGATVCKPQLPLCTTCVLQKKCKALQQNEVSSLPIKTKKLIIKNRFFFFVVAIYQQQVYVQKRVEKDIWQNLWQFIPFEMPANMSFDALQSSESFQNIFTKPYQVKFVSAPLKQKLTHQHIEVTFVVLQLQHPLQLQQWQLQPVKQLRQLPFPRIVTQFFENNTSFT